MPDIDEAEAQLAEMGGIENSWVGRVLIRLVRAVRFLHGRSSVQTARIQALEDRVSALEAPPTPE